MSRHFSDDLEIDVRKDSLDRLSEAFPGIPKEQIERAKQYREARKKFVKTLSRALSDSDRQYQIAQFSHRWWKIDDEPIDIGPLKI